MKRIVAWFSMLFIIITGCNFQNNSAYNYYNSYFEFEDNNEPKTIYVVNTQNCYSCNISLIDSLAHSNLQENEYYLLISRYPYCEKEKKNTLLMKEKFGKRFRIDSTDNALNYTDIPKNSTIVRF